MTEQTDSHAYGDALSRPFWEAASRGVLAVQECQGCGHRQHYPRPLCLRCGVLELAWRDCSGLGTVHSLTTVRRQIRPELEPPYDVALIDLDEGPRLLAGLTEEPGATAMGDRVEVVWRERDGKPPLAMFRKLD